ncbi:MULTISPECIES: FtsQ-type POTRA domain-containing protein [unclassified Curtobacterium]|uniref:FtsQ-type POTRA domain-containing protein n=1 Tax=unclassified Curtobacterium TaxID=257496 RepID=UPI000A99D061|nr:MULTISPECIES: FtsQ-type POTRA domain-containing protein [unclassified Curtobacterium]WIA98115.1 FtsQ-type POTRA domain-containing protein [Curtobacterium sp. MCBA15_004]WIB01368.1 FtsQ-type POTRA domain-containing protein [Curtobacterium sp. MCBA15_012]
MKRPEGFDERPDHPDAPADGADAPRQRRGPRIPRRASRAVPADGREAQPAPAPSAAVPETAGRPPGAAPDAGHDEQASADGGSVRDRAGAAAGVAGRRLGAGLSSVAERLRGYAPDEEHRPAGSGRAEHADDDRGDGGRDHVATVTDVLDAHRASRPSDDHEDHATPIGAGVRAAETAREARVAKRRRRLLERNEVRRFTRRSRHRRAAWTTAAAVVVVFGASLLVAVYSPLMALQTIEIKGTNRVDETALRQALSAQLGTPLARLDLGEVKREVAGFPLIESYVTEEVPPHTLVVTVTERTPVVAVQSGSAFDLVDPAGIVVQSSPSRPDGVPLADVSRAKLGSPVFRTMTEVVLALPSAVRSQVTDLRASTADDVTLTLRDGSNVVWGSPEDSEAKAALLAALVKDHEGRAPGTPVEYDVSAPDNGIVRAKQ